MSTLHDLYYLFPIGTTVRYENRPMPVSYDGEYPITSEVFSTGTDLIPANLIVYGTVVGYSADGDMAAVRSDIDPAGEGLHPHIARFNIHNVELSRLAKSDHEPVFTSQNPDDISEAITLSLDVISTEVYDYEQICSMAKEYLRITTGFQKDTRGDRIHSFIDLS